MLSDEGGIGTISASSSVRRTRSSRGDFFRIAGVVDRAALALAFDAVAAFAGLAGSARLASLADLAGLAGLALRAPLARLAERWVGRLAERFACLDLGRGADRRLRAAGAGFFRRVAFPLAMTRPLVLG